MVEREMFGMLKYIIQKVESMKEKTEKRKTEKRRLSFMDAGTLKRVPALCVLIPGLAVISLCGCEKISDGKNIFQEENRSATDNQQSLDEGDVSAAETDGVVEEVGNDEEITVSKPYVDMLEKKAEEDIKSYFETVSTEPATMKENGYVILQWDEVLNLERYWSFEERYLAGEPADLILVQYTEEEFPYFDYLFFTGSNVVHFRKFPDGGDKSPSAAEVIASEGSAADEVAPENLSQYETYDYLHTFVQRAEERDRYKTLVLSNEKDLTYQEFETLFYQEEPSVETSFVASFFYVEE